MNKKFGAGKPPTGTPSLAWSCVVVIASLLSGASIVHNIYKPDLVSPTPAPALLLYEIHVAHHLFDKMLD
ncbi:unnamed protein product [Linum tenue]|uniref:Uncharacterized protein n=1 Tax=Linum tenue TaxID=586396 RepID=A0AAV0JR73_9ROSI|nr:unnamed protein product [Linum tenue]